MNDKASLIKFIDTIELLSKSKSLRDGDIEESLKEILKLATEALDCQRSNVWLFNEDYSILESLMSYVKSGMLYNVEKPLYRKDFPIYFSGLDKNDIIPSDNALEEGLNVELIDIYIIPKDIKSMIDIPIRSEGKMIGVVCFEQTKVFRKWSHEDLKFAQSLAQIISITIETNKKNKYRARLESLIKEKNLLISEINHRVKNNISVVMGLINLQKEKCRDDYHSNLFTEIKDKVFSMSAVHEQLLQNKEMDQINLGDFITSLSDNLRRSFENEIEVVIEKEGIFIDITQGIPLGLMANEIITNSYKHAFGDENKTPQLTIKCYQIDKTIFISFQDNGEGYDLTSPNTGMGMGIIQDLCEQIDGEIEFNNSINGAKTTIKFQNL